MEVHAATAREAATGSTEPRRSAAAGRQEARRPARAAVQGQGLRRVARGLLRAAGRDRQGGLARPAGHRHRARRQGRDPRPTPGRSGPTPTSRSSAPAPRWSRSTRPTRPRSASTCIDHSEAKAVILEDEEQLAKIREVRDQLPKLQTIVSMEPIEAEDVITLRRAARARPRPPGRGLRPAHRGGRRLDGRHLHLHLRARPGRPRAASSTTRTGARSSTWSRSRTTLVERERIYLFLPLAHAFARLIQLGGIDVGASIAYWEKDPTKIIPNLMEVKPSYFPSVPRIFEKIYAMAVANAPDPEQLRQAVELGTKVRDMQARGEEVPEKLQKAFDQADEQLYSNVRNLFGGNIKQAVTGAAPIAQEILEFFYACGVLVLEGWGMTETSTAATCNQPDAFRFGSVGRPVQRRRGQDRRGRRDPGPRQEHLPRLLQEPGRHRRRRSSTAGCTPATSARSTRTASSTSPAARRTSSSRPAARTSRPRTSRTGSSRTSTSHRRSSTATAGPT